MKWLWNDKDGGQESRVWCYGLEIKSLFSVLLLRFEDGSREMYHSHAFNCLNWVLKGTLLENRYNESETGFFQEFIYDHLTYKTSIKPFIIRREDLHKVTSVGRTWVLSFRGPWTNTWQEWDPKTEQFITLTHGRKVI